MLRMTWRNLFARKVRKLFVFERLFDRPQTVRPFRVAGRRQVIETGGMGDE